MKYLFSFCITTAIITLSFGQNRFDDVQIKTTKVTDHIYMFEGSGGNIGVLTGEDGVFMIDDQYAPLSDKIYQAIRELTESEFSYIVNTHWHGDHTGGNENFANKGAIIVSHENVRARLSTEQKRGERITPPSSENAWPRITFTEEMTMYLNGQQVLMIHVHNAHTDGDSFVWFPESNVIHMGDCFFQGRFPFIDLDSGGSVEGAIKAVEVALMLIDDNTQIIPGHGALATKKDLKVYHEFLITIRDRVNEYLHSGRGLESLRPDDIVKGYEDWSWGFINAEKLSQTFYKSLSAE